MASLLLAFLLIPFVDLFLLVPIGRAIGAAPTILFVVLSGLLGSYVARREGRRVMGQWQGALEQGRVPEEGVLGGLLVLVGGLLLITPGLITDLLGVVLLLPWTRRFVTHALRGYLERQIASGALHLQGFGFRTPHTGFERRQSRFEGHSPDVQRYPTEVGRGPARRSGDIVDTEGEEVR